MAAPACTIVVPTRDRRTSLEMALEALVAQQPAGFAELIVVDDGSRDGTPQLLGRLAAQGKVLALRTGGEGPAAARNAGLARAAAPVVAFTDDDCQVGADWAARLVRRLAETGAAAVGGRVVPARDASRPARVSQAITNGLVRAVNSRPDAAAFLTSNNVAYRVDAVRAAGGFDEGFRAAAGEDRDLHHRLQGRGERLVYAEDIVVVHRPPMDWTGFLSQQTAYGRAARRFYATPGRDHLSLAHYGRALVAAFRDASPADWPALCVGVAGSQAAVLTGYLLGPRR